MRPRTGPARFAILCALILLVWGCVPLPQTMPPQPVPRPPGSAGETMEQFVQQQGGIYADAELASYVRERGLFWGRRSARPELTWTFSILDHAAAEVHLFPQGQVFLTRGAIVGLKDWHQLDRLLRAVAVDAADAPTAPRRTFDLARFMAYPEADLPGHPPTGAALFAERLQSLKETVSGYEVYASGRRLEKVGDLTGAIRAYLQAATLAPDQPKILTGLGLAYLQAGDLPSARTHLSRAVRLQPDYYLSRMGRGYVFLQQDDGPQAIAELEKSVALLPIVRNRYLLAESYAKAGQIDKARALFLEVASEDRGGKLGRAAATQARALEKTR